MSITVEAMKPKLLTLEQLSTSLSRTEPLGTEPFTVGDEIRFTVEPGWNHGIDAKTGTDLVGVWASLGKGAGYIRDYQLTKDAVLEATSLTGMNKSFAAKSPNQLLEPTLNYWFREGLGEKRIRDYQFLIANGVGAAVTRASIVPFSNLRLVEQALASIEGHYGAGEVLVDYKFTHTLRKTHLRLIVPEQRRVIAGTGTADDVWSVGIQIKNSLTGYEQTEVDGYLFRWTCTNGAIDTHCTSGAFTRRGGSNQREHEVYEWARVAVDGVLGGLEASLDAVQQLVDIPIAGQAADVLRDVFNHYHVPVAERARIIERMVDTDQLTMYSVMAAVTEIANDASMEASHVENLLRLGGDLPHAAHSRCDACRRLMPH